MQDSIILRAHYGPSQLPNEHQTPRQRLRCILAVLSGFLLCCCIKLPQGDASKTTWIRLSCSDQTGNEHEAHI
jgi:hypothetical protein